MFTTYVIRNENGKIYVGQTINLEKRLAQHNDKNYSTGSYTKINHGLWIVIYKEEFNTRDEEKKRERELKSSRGRDFIHKIILGP